MLFNNRNGRRGSLIFFPLIAVAAVLVMGGLVMLLWNAVLPAVVQVGALSYPQGIALLVLCRILFGNFGNRRPLSGAQAMSKSRKQWREKLMHMTPEERERFQQQWKSRCRPQNK